MEAFIRYAFSESGEVWIRLGSGQLVFDVPGIPSVTFVADCLSSGMRERLPSTENPDHVTVYDIHCPQLQG